MELVQVCGGMELVQVWGGMELVQVCGGMELVQVWGGMELVQVWGGMELVQVCGGMELVQVWGGMELVQVCGGMEQYRSVVAWNSIGLWWHGTGTGLRWHGTGTELCGTITHNNHICPESALCCKRSNKIYSHYSCDHQLTNELLASPHFNVGKNTLLLWQRTPASVIDCTV